MKTSQDFPSIPSTHQEKFLAALPIFSAWLLGLVIAFTLSG